jgi:hypothetical protein
MSFNTFAQAIQARFDALSQHELFITNQDKDRTYAVYLDAFPAGTNPIFRERTEHDCSCCRQFLKNLANVVAIVDGKVLTLWDNPSQFEYPYDVVANELREFTLDHPISTLFRSREPQYGKTVTYEHVTDGKAGEVLTWNHFQGIVAAKHRAAEPQQVIGEFNTTVQMLERAASELSVDAYDTVIGLIEANNLYRGEEFIKGVRASRDLAVGYNEALMISASEANIFVWANAGNPHARFRNTAIGTLVVDLSEGMDLETAVKVYEKKVAPENYKRPTALITPVMIDSALKTVDELGLRDALERRFAVLEDVSVNNVLWVNNATQAKMKDGLAGLLMEAAVVDNGYDPKKVEAISIDQFMALTPQLTSIKALLKNRQQGNLMSLTTAVYPDAGQLFKWDNPFAWSYHGNITDSVMRQAVQAKGGRVDGVLRFTHSWNHDAPNTSLMDLHVFMPGSTHRSGQHDTYGSGQRVGWNQRSDFASGGSQDVDYTGAAPKGYIPVENITFPTLDKLRDGQYHCKIHNWSLRQGTKGGFRAEIEFDGQLFEYEYPDVVQHKQWIDVATVTLKNGVFSIEHHLPTTASSQKVWGLQTETFVQVNSLMFSPNFWDGQTIGNKHWFFLLDGAVNNEPTRGIYNEYLASGLEQHRKVFEVLGDKTKCPPTADQLSGLGFSSTKGDSLIVQVAGPKLRKTYQINF